MQHKGGRGSGRGMAHQHSDPGWEEDRGKIHHHRVPSTRRFGSKISLSAQAAEQKHLRTRKNEVCTDFLGIG